MSACLLVCRCYQNPGAPVYTKKHEPGEACRRKTTRRKTAYAGGGGKSDVSPVSCRKRTRTEEQKEGGEGSSSAQATVATPAPTSGSKVSPATDPPVAFPVPAGRVGSPATCGTQIVAVMRPCSLGNPYELDYMASDVREQRVIVYEAYAELLKWAFRHKPPRFLSQRSVKAIGRTWGVQGMIA
ncbi:hypothetical protein AB1Y20_016549 [Prymnesium parvum]|uniref:Uncharacterized protein n=1 Tax=Prymnesium parvum TaxID=97485 RepID=A0AB34IAD6_PRYPA